MFFENPVSLQKNFKTKLNDMNKRVFFLLLVLMACAAQSMAQSMVWGINTMEPENSIIGIVPTGSHQ